ncbi:MAG: IS1380 family transposase [Pirellulaceae bacterium]
MNTKLRKQLRQRKQKLDQRIDKSTGFSESRIRGGKVKYELSDRQQAVASGGLGMILQMVSELKLRQQINRAVPIFKFYAPYDETDHILNIALNLLSGGTCLDHLEYRRTDEAYLDALGSRRIPDPTTAGDFCRRFSDVQILQVMQAFNRVRQTVWRQQPDSFFDQATIEADGTMVETRAEKKDGIGINHQGQWGYHPLIVSLAETQEVLYLQNRSGNRPSHENAAFFFDLAIEQCRKAGFRKIVLRGDTDFSQTEFLDRWNDDRVEFVFGYDATPNLQEKANSLDKNQWKTLSRDASESSQPRSRREKFKEQIVVDNNYKNLVLVKESYAEFAYQPTKCSRPYRMVVVRKEIECSRGQLRLFDDDQVRYFFYITNARAKDLPTREVIRGANQRCNQENTISQLKASHCLTAPLSDLTSNWAYMVFASLAWTLKQWSGLMVRVQGNPNQRAKPGHLRNWVIRMEFATFLNSLILIPAQVLRSSRQTIFRLLSYRPTLENLLLIHQHIALPLRH